MNDKDSEQRMPKDCPSGAPSLSCCQTLPIQAPRAARLTMVSVEMEGAHLGCHHTGSHWCGGPLIGSGDLGPICQGRPCRVLFCQSGRKACYVRS